MSSLGRPSSTDVADFSHDTKRHSKSPSQRQTIEPATNFILGDRITRESHIPTSHQAHTTMRAIGSGNIQQQGQMTDNEVELLKHLASDFAGLLNRIDISDCLLCVKGTYMAVHRCVLAARSNTFAAVISGNGNRLDGDTRQQLQTLTEKDKLVIVIDKTEPEVMKQLIIFLYTSRCELNKQNAYALLDAAGRYDVKSLKVYTGQFLVNHIETSNVLRLLTGAYTYKNILLQQHCIAYFLKHSRDVMNIQQEWKTFADDYPTIVAELLYWVVHPQDFAEKMPYSGNQSQW